MTGELVISEREGERSDQISKKVFYERPNKEIRTSSSVGFHFLFDLNFNNTLIVKREMRDDIKASLRF